MRWIGRALDMNGDKRNTIFSDVSPNSFGSGYIEASTEDGLVTGYEDGTFQTETVH